MHAARRRESAERSLRNAQRDDPALIARPRRIADGRPGGNHARHHEGRIDHPMYRTVMRSRPRVSLTTGTTALSSTPTRSDHRSTSAPRARRFASGRSQIVPRSGSPEVGKAWSCKLAVVPRNRTASASTLSDSGALSSNLLTSVRSTFSPPRSSRLIASQSVSLTPHGPTSIPRYSGRARSAACRASSFSATADSSRVSTSWCVITSAAMTQTNREGTRSRVSPPAARATPAAERLPRSISIRRSASSRDMLAGTSGSSSGPVHPSSQRKRTRALRLRRRTHPRATRSHVPHSAHSNELGARRPSRVNSSRTARA